MAIHELQLGVQVRPYLVLHSRRNKKALWSVQTPFNFITYAPFYRIENLCIFFPGKNRKPEHLLTDPTMLLSKIFGTQGEKFKKDANKVENIKTIYFDFDPGLKSPILLAD